MTWLAKASNTVVSTFDDPECLCGMYFEFECNRHHPMKETNNYEYSPKAQPTTAGDHTQGALTTSRRGHLKRNVG